MRHFSVRYVIKQWDGVRVGVMGLVEFEWLATLATLDVDDLVYLDFVDEGRRLAALLRAEGCDVVVALTHMRAPNDLLLGAEVPEIDIILGGHDHHYEARKGTCSLRCLAALVSVDSSSERTAKLMHALAPSPTLSPPGGALRAKRDAHVQERHRLPRAVAHPHGGDARHTAARDA